MQCAVIRGKTFINKLGSLLRVFKSGKQREFGREKDDFINITSESGIRTSGESSSHQDSDSTNRNVIIKKSKSIESIATGTVGRVNELKRSHGTCDILNSNKEEEIKCTKSLNRFGQLTHTNNCVFSYHAKLHDSTIWSQALGRATERPNSKKNESTSSSTIQVEEQQSFERKNICPTRNEEAAVNFQEPKRDKWTYAKTEYPIVAEKLQENASNPPLHNKESDNKDSVSSNTQTYGDKENEASSNVKIGSSKVQELRPPITEMRRNIYEVLEEVKPQLESSISMHQNYETECTESSKITLDEEQKLQVKMDHKTIKNELGFDLLEYDVKSSGDHVVDPRTFLEDFVRSTNSSDVVVHPTSYESEQTQENIVNSPKVSSDNTTEYEVVNLGQVDLFKEFKTTISKMRNVLNVLDVKKSLDGDTRGNLCERKMKKSSTEILEAENISTQTAAMTFNQISTSTDGGSSNQTRNEGIMVQLSSDTTTNCKSNSKHITLDTKLFNYMKPLNKTRRRRKRGYRYKQNKVIKKAMNVVSSSQDGQLKTKMKTEKPHYNKCVVYHITQHKNAVDRSVGPPCPTAKEKLVLQNTFSALHFGPIREFPILLNKREHEYEKKKKREEEQKVLTIASPKDQDEIKSTSFLSSEISKSSNQNSCHKSGTQSSLKCASPKKYSSFSTSTATANWFVFEPSPPMVMKKGQSTSDDLLFDANRSSTQELVSNILEEELKTSGLKGRISSSTMNLIKEKFYDKLSGLKSKDVPDVMITVCVPLKNIVSKIKTSKRAGCEDKAVSFTNSTDSHIKSASSSGYDKGIQVNIPKNYVNDNLQTIPEKMCKKSAEIYKHNKLLRESMSSKRLSTFKKIFGNKATSCSSINPFGHLAPRKSRIYFSDHSTSSPNFAVKPVVRDPIRCAHKKILTEPKSTSVSLSGEEIGYGSKNKKEGFFLNLPPNSYRKKREQISKLFDGSDSSDRRYFGEPKLLYHVHDSSFYSTSKTDHKPSSGRLLLETSASNEKSKISYFPVQKVSSRVDCKVKPKCISFCDLPRSCDSEAQTTVVVLERPTKDYRHLEVKSKPNLRNADVNTSNIKLFQDNATQFESEMGVSPQASANEKHSTRKKTKRIVGTDNFFDNSIDEFSVVSLPKVHFKDDANDEHCEKLKNTRTQSVSSERQNIQGAKVENNLIKIKREPTRKSVSVLSLFSEDNESPENKYVNRSNEEIDGKQIDEDVEQSRKQMQRKIIHHKSNIFQQTSSESNLIDRNQEKSAIQLASTGTTAALESKRKCKKSKDIVRTETTQVDSITSLPKKENCIVQVEVPNETKNESRLAVLMRDVVNLCNSSFVKSRDCIVELTLYNLIKEIIMEHCSHLSDQSRQKIESILANFIKLSKQKAGNQDVEIVESAIERLVKEIGPTDEPVNDHGGKDEEALHLYGEYEQDIREEHEQKYNRKHARSKSKHREHKHQSKHRSHHREIEDEHREKHHHRGKEEKNKSKRHHRHHCDNDGSCDMDREESETKFRSVDGRREYLELVQRLKELEDVTKQLSNVAQNKQNQRQQFGNKDDYRKHKNWYTEYLFTRPKFSPKKKKKLSLTEFDENCRQYQKEPVQVNYFQTELKQGIPSSSRNFSKIPVTKIVINISNLKLLARNCVSLMSTSMREPIVITDSTEEKQELMNKIVSYKISEKCRSRIKHSSKQLEKVRKNNIKGTRSEVINRNKESFTITIHGENREKKDNPNKVKTEPPRNKRDYMRIKMVRKKKTVTSKNDQKPTDSHCVEEKNIDLTESSDIHQITKEYIQKEYKLKSDYLSSRIAKDLLENKCNMNQVLDYRGNLDMAYRRMANFCLFRGLLRKD